MRRLPAMLVLAAILALGADSPLTYQRKVQFPQGASLPAVVVTEFLSGGELDPQGHNLAVHDGRGQPVPWKVLQVGPGDFCRIAFQTVPRQHLYKILHGGGTVGQIPATAEAPPEWTARGGLLVETRRLRPCDFQHFDAVQRAYTEAEPIGAAFVPSVFHRFNPAWPEPEPFLSLYRGTLQIGRGGRYRFFTTSQDCSFLRIDGKLVASAPGWHGAVGDARHGGEIDLTPGPHVFEYLHAASGPDACMVAAWQPPGATAPVLIPAEAFGSDDIARLPASSVRRPRELAYEVLGEAATAEGDPPLVRVQFRQLSGRGGTSRTRLHWDFGDGQSSSQAEPTHIYLRPGVYRVAMRAPGEGDAAAVVQRVPIHRALVLAEPGQKPDELASYLGMVEKYDPAKLDPAGLRQWLRTLDGAGQADRAARGAQAAILSRTEPSDDDALHEVVRAAGSLLRDRLDDPEAAFTLFQGAVKALGPEAWKAECEIEAADLALGSLLRPEPARGLLEVATARLAVGVEPALLARLHRVWGDWYARKGDRAAAQAAYARAAAANPSHRNTAEQDAWRGAFSRSAEAFLRAGDLDRARDELRRWQEEFPGDRTEGYLSSLQADGGPAADAGRRRSPRPATCWRSTRSRPTPTAWHTWPPAARRS